MLTKSQILFLSVCVPIRIIFVYFAKQKKFLKEMAILALFVSIGFACSTRKRGIETFGEKIWWGGLRPFHSLMYLSFAVSVFLSLKEIAWIPLALDVFIGVLASILKNCN